MDHPTDYFIIAFCIIGPTLLLFILKYLSRIEGHLRDMNIRQAEAAVKVRRKGA